MSAQSNKYKMYKENLIIALSLSMVFGLGWGFGLLATSNPVEGINITLQVIFSIFVGLQGVLLFLLHGVRNSDARKVWKRWLIFLNSVTGICCLQKAKSKSVTLGRNSPLILAKSVGHDHDKQDAPVDINDQKDASDAEDVQEGGVQDLPQQEFVELSTKSLTSVYLKEGLDNVRESKIDLSKAESQ